MIWKIPGCVPNSRAKETVLLNFLRCDRLFWMLIQHDLNVARIGSKDTDLQIVANSVRTQDSKGIGMDASDEAVHFVRRQSSDLERFHHVVKKLKEL
jgi:hypothetical protein